MSKNKVTRICNHCGQENIYFERYLIGANYTRLKLAVGRLICAPQSDLSQYTVQLCAAYDKCLEHEASFYPQGHRRPVIQREQSLAQLQS